MFFFIVNAVNKQHEIGSAEHRKDREKYKKIRGDIKLLLNRFIRLIPSGRRLCFAVVVQVCFNN